MNTLFVYYNGKLFDTEKTFCNTILEMNLSNEFEYELVQPDGQLALF